MTSVALLFAVGVLIFLNGFFVAAEFALVRSRRALLQADADAGRRGASTALVLMDDLSRYLSSCQLGITLASLGIGFLGEPAIASLVEGALGESLPHGVTLAISLGLAYLITTALHITIGEQVPKIYAIQRAEPVSRFVAGPLLLFSRVLQPFITLLNNASNAMLRVVGMRSGSDLEEGESPQELRVLIQESVTGGKLDPGEATMLTGVFNLHEQQARQVMTPIPSVVTVDVGDRVEEALRRAIASGHTRLVVTEGENHDRIKGIAHSNALAQVMLTEGPDASIEAAVRDALIVPETKPLDDLLADLRRARSSLAVVVDEYGRTEGIVTVEDIVEEVVGEIDDETDPQGGGVRKLPNGDWYVRGEVPIADLEDYGLELPADSEAYNSVGGFVFGELGRLPRRGDTVSHNGYSIRVESVRENRIEAVRIRERRVGAEAAARRAEP